MTKTIPIVAFLRLACPIVMLTVPGLALPQEEAFLRETDFALRAMSSEDAREGPKAFKEKRKPVFKGR